MMKNIWFIGTGNFAALCLAGLINNGLTFTKIITGLPTRSGRNGKENPSPVESKANELGLKVIRTGKLNENENLLHELDNDTPELIFVIDFGQIIKEPFLSTPKYGCLNIHPSLLPLYRGAAPIQRALMNGEKFTGVSVFQLVKAMDAGGILAQSKFEIPENFNASDLYVKLSEIGCKIAAEALRKIPEFALTPQDDSLATYAHKLDKDEFEVSFSMTAKKFCDTVRALDMSGGAFMMFGNKRVKIWRAKIHSPEREEGPFFDCADGSVELLEVQSEGKKRTSGKDWARGFKNF
ncbi:MAG: methionyl-tRNA formyltransferase [Synergistaceae bacterium]|nr:methionyl-tRNA formyltransferase [Synergistaceae bacterium]